MFAALLAAAAATAHTPAPLPGGLAWGMSPQEISADRRAFEAENGCLGIGIDMAGERGRPAMACFDGRGLSELVLVWGGPDAEALADRHTSLRARLTPIFGQPVSYRDESQPVVWRSGETLVSLRQAQTSGALAPSVVLVSFRRLPLE